MKFECLRRYVLEMNEWNVTCENLHLDWPRFKRATRCQLETLHASFANWNSFAWRLRGKATEMLSDSCRAWRACTTTRTSTSVWSVRKAATCARTTARASSPSTGSWGRPSSSWRSSSSAVCRQWPSSPGDTATSRWARWNCSKFKWISHGRPVELRHYRHSNGSIVDPVLPAWAPATARDVSDELIVSGGGNQTKISSDFRRSQATQYRPAKNSSSTASWWLESTACFW